MKKYRFSSVISILFICFILLFEAGCVGRPNADSDIGGGSVSNTTERSDTVTVTFSALKTIVKTVKKGERVADPRVVPKKSGCAFVGWYLNDKAYDWNTPVDTDITLTAKFERSDYSVYSGFAYSEGQNYVTATNKTLLAFDGRTFNKGLLSATVTPDSACDCGVIFGLSDEGLSDNFWENESYYCALINRQGYFIFAQVGKNGVEWDEISSNSKLVSSYNAKKAYSFDIYYEDGYCAIDVDGINMTATEIDAFAGGRFGFRSMASGTVFGQPVVNENISVVERQSEKVGDFYVMHGAFNAVGDYYMSYESDTVGVWADKSFESGEYSATVSKVKAGYDDGIIFCLDDGGKTDFWEVGVTYYFFFISRSNCPYLGKVTGEKENLWEVLSVGDVLDESEDYKLKVVLDGSYIRCYVNDVLLIEYFDAQRLTGKKVGFRSGSDSTFFSLFELK